MTTRTEAPATPTAARRDRTRSAESRAEAIRRRAIRAAKYGTAYGHRL